MNIYSIDKEWRNIVIVLESKEETEIILRALNYGRRGGFPDREKFYQKILDEFHEQGYTFKDC